MNLAHSLQVVRVVPQGTDAMLLSVAPAPTELTHFSFHPGQYLTVAGGPADAEQWRCYSLISDPVDTQALSVLVRRVPGGFVSNWLCDHVQPGMQLKVLPPAGRFQLRHPDRPALLFAGGSGIAPIFSLARQALEAGAPKVCLFYANRDQGTAMLMDELSVLKARYGLRLDLRCWYDDQSGLPSAQVLAACAKDTDACEAYLCGPDPFMRAVEGALVSAGMEAEHILREAFALADEGSSDELSSEDALSTAHLTVKLKGQSHQLEIQRRDTLLAAMIKGGLPVPHACKVGECASCICRLESGDVERLSNSVLDDDDAEAGWLVACRTRARGDNVSIKF